MPVLQVVTRLINLEEGGHLIPLIDMANHRQDCPKHHIDVVACDQVATSNKSAASSSKDASTRVLNTTRLCVIWTAGADLSAGDEVCRSYGYLLPDRTFLQYGFIPTEFVAAKERQQSLSRSVAVPLFGMDRADFQELAEESLPWTFWLDRDTGPEPFRGNKKIRNTCLEQMPEPQLALVHSQVIWLFEGVPEPAAPQGLNPTHVCGKLCSLVP